MITAFAEPSIVTICPECDEAFMFVAGAFPLIKNCPHCKRKIKIKKIQIHEEDQE